MPPLPADSIHARACKLKCEKILTRPRSQGHLRFPGALVPAFLAKVPLCESLIFSRATAPNSFTSIKFPCAAFVSAGE